MSDALSNQESVQLVELEQVIERGKQTFVEVGNALAEIRDSRIYRAAFTTFEDYCRERWGWSRQNAAELITAAEVSKNLSGTPDKPTITAVAQARPLAKLPADQQPAPLVTPAGLSFTQPAS